MFSLKPLPSIPHPWYKIKRYLHFDYAFKKPKAISFVVDKKNIIHHSFSPVIHYTETTRKYKRNKDTRQLEVSKKPRNIFYASHLDGYIYSYYNHILGLRYEAYLEKYGLTQSVTAYRSLQKNGEGCSNIHFAEEAFEFLKHTKECNVLCIDISKFFDKLSTSLLKNRWARVWSDDKSSILEDDHFAVFRSLDNFHYVEEEDVIRILEKEPRKRAFPKDGKLASQKKSINQSLFNRICDFTQLKKKKESVTHSFIREKKQLQITGIPQGTAISGLLANIFMIEFDLAMKEEVEKVGGLYRRHSDDIFVAFPCSLSFEAMKKIIICSLTSFSGKSLEINSGKTEERIYKDGACYKADEKLSPIQYLGFAFHGNKTHIRSSTISRNRSKISYLISKNRKGKGSISKQNNINTRKVYKAQSQRKITPYDNINNKGFISYAERSKKIQAAPEIVNQIRKNDRFIKNKIEESR